MVSFGEDVFEYCKGSVFWNTEYIRPRLKSLGRITDRC